MWRNHKTRCSIIFTEEQLNEIDLITAIEKVKEAEVLIIGGTSLNVYPAAGLINYFKGNHLILINKEKTPYDTRCDLVIYDSIGKVMEEILKEIKRR